MSEKADTGAVHSVAGAVNTTNGPPVIEAEVIDPRKEEAKAKAERAPEASASSDIFTKGERIASDIDEVAEKVAAISPKIGAQGRLAAEALRTTASQGRVIAAHVGETLSAVRDLTETLERKGIPIRKGVDKVWQTTPLPGFGRKR